MGLTLIINTCITMPQWEIRFLKGAVWPADLKSVCTMPQSKFCSDVALDVLRFCAFIRKSEHGEQFKSDLKNILPPHDHTG